MAAFCRLNALLLVLAVLCVLVLAVNPGVIPHPNPKHALSQGGKQHANSTNSPPPTLHTRATAPQLPCTGKQKLNTGQQCSDP